MLGRRRHFVERAIHTVADFEFVLERFKMNVTGAVLDGLKEHQIDEANDRRLVGQIGQVGRRAAGRGFGRFARDFIVLAQVP